MLNIRIEGERELTLDLERIKSKAPVSIKKIVRDSAFLIERKIKGNLSNVVLNVRTGQLRRSIHTEFSGNGMNAVIGTNLVYAAIHEFGGEIHAKNGPYLWFKIQTASRIMSKAGNRLKNAKGIFSWVRVKSVTIPARPYMEPAFRESLPLIDHLIEAEIERLLAT
jgi:phage gpG-like protein